MYYYKIVINVSFEIYYVLHSLLFYILIQPISHITNIVEL